LIDELKNRIALWQWVIDAAEGTKDPSVFEIVAHPRNDFTFHLDVRGRKTVYIQPGVETDALIAYAESCMAALKREKERSEAL
jgi:hypothetical protein